MFQQSVAANYSTPPQSVNSDLYRLSLGGDKYLVVTRYRGVLKVHIRRYDVMEGERMYPTRYGVSFLPNRFANLLNLEPSITRRVNNRLGAGVDEEGCVKGEWRRHLGGGTFVVINQKIDSVSLRSYFRPDKDGVELPTKMGLTVPFSTWQKLVDGLNIVHHMFPELRYAQPCYASDDHANQEGLMNCRECTPFGITYGNDEQ